MLSYEEALARKRDLMAGHYKAPKPFGVVDPKLERPKRKKLKLATSASSLEDQLWDEHAFVDDFYPDDSEEADVVPDYFHSCDVLDTTYSSDNNMAADYPSLPLFRGSTYTGKDLARFLLSFKARHLKIGDGILANIVAIMATFLPNDNVLKKCLPEKTSTYFLLKSLDNLASFKTYLRCLKIDCCPSNKKCMGFYGDNANLNFCLTCGTCRWKLCTDLCYENDVKTCEHLQTPRESLYYNVVQDRLVKLLKSDLKNLFNYDFHRAGNVMYVILTLSIYMYTLYFFLSIPLYACMSGHVCYVVMCHDVS